MMSVSRLQLMFPCSPCTYSLFQVFYFYTALYVFYPLQLPPQSSAASHTDQYRTCPHLNVSSVFIIDLCLCVLVLVYQTSLISSAPGVQETLLYVVLQSHTDQYRTCPHLNVSSVFIIDLCLCAGARLSNVSYILSTRSTRDTTVCSSSITHRSVPYMPTSQCIVCIYY